MAIQVLSNDKTITSRFGRLIFPLENSYLSR